MTVKEKEEEQGKSYWTLHIPWQVSQALETRRRREIEGPAGRRRRRTGWRVGERPNPGSLGPFAYPYG